MQLQPQEVEVFYLLPAIRSELSKELKNIGKSQKEIAKLLGVTEAAVSQYVTSKRGAIQLPAIMKQQVKNAAPKITDHQSMIRETQSILKHAKTDRFICKMHEQVAIVPKGCDVCFR